MNSSDIDGVMVPPEDVEALAHAMDRLLNNKDERLRLGARGDRDHQHFRLAQVAEMWEGRLQRSA